MKLIPNPLKPVTVWLLGIAAIVAGLEQFVPELKSALPESWHAYVFPAILVARLVLQSQAAPKEPKPAVRVVERGFVGMKLMLLLAAMGALVLANCGGNRPPARTPCYLQVSAEFYARGVEECEAEGAASIDECKAWPALEAEMAQKQGACP
jgi:hypothetical protein